jgi:peptidoglycan/LPS O-acetylase OafA/YrhL
VTAAATVGAATAAGPQATIRQAGEVRSARIESLRAVAALAVLAAHVFLVAHRGNFAQLESSLPRRVLLGGGAGVWLFFALTGYLLFWPFARHHFGAGDPTDLRRYAINRALRILPLYYAVLVVFMITEADGGSLGQWWRFATFSENFFSSTVSTVDGPMWSLVVELHFYILLPLLAWALARVTRGNLAGAGLVLVVLAAASFYLHWTKVDNVTTALDQRWEFSLPVTFFFFVPGMLLALGRLALEERPRRPRWLNGPAARSDLWLVASLAVWVFAVDDLKRTGLCALAAFLTVGACVLPLRTGRLTRALAWRPLAALGVASYSLYLWHFPLVHWLYPTPASTFWGLAALSVPLSVVVALLSYRAIESPFLKLRRRWTRTSPAPPPAPRLVTPVGVP